MPRFTNTYSRGNDDPGQNVYETATIEVTLDLDNSDCREDKEGRCVGDVKLKLEYKATASTVDPLFVTAGPRYALRETGPGGASNQLQHNPGAPAGPQGDTLTGELSLGSIPCKGGSKKGEIDVEARIIPPPGGGPPQWTGFVQQRILYEVEIRECGQVNVMLLDVQQLNPAVVLRAIPTPLRQTGSTIIAGPWPPGYPAFPGQPR